MNSMCTIGVNVVRLSCYVLGVVLAAAVASAHDPGLSTVQGVWTPTTLDLTTAFALNDAQHLLGPDARGSSRFSAAEFARMRPAFEVAAAKLWEVRANGHVLMPLATRVELLAGDNLSLVARFPRKNQSQVTLRTRQLGLLPAGHLQFVVITDESGTEIAKKLLSAKDDVLEFPTPGVNTNLGRPPTFLGFVRLGIQHIWTGYDHLLFLLALLIVCRSFRSIVAIVSCFTLAHSLTLALATLNVINLPSFITEPAIAASIVYVGAENLLRRGAEPRGRWALTFAFGLIHGFGFATVLRDLGVGARGESIALPLFTFNLGVEIGQIVIAAITLPLIWHLRKNDTFVRVGVSLLSGAVVAAGLYWFLERTMFA